MTDHFARPHTAASSERVAELHRLCDEDYVRGQSERTIASLSPSYAAAAASVHVPELSDLDIAIRVGQRMLTVYLAVDRGDVDALNQAYGGVSEALYILLRALSAAPVDEQEAARRSVDRAFPAVAEFLAAERGEAE